MAHVQSNAVPHAPPRNGRRLIQMLFCANQEEESLDSRWEDNRDTRHDHATSFPESLGRRLDELASIDTQRTRPTNGKFSALKRKLFPSTQRRAPLRVPALLPLSPIDTAAPFSPTEPDFKLEECGDGEGKSTIDVSVEDRGGNNDTLVDQFAEWSGIESTRRFQREDSTQCEPAVSARPGDESDEEDRDLELAIEVVDFESSNAEETLAEMSKAIDQVREWKQQHEQSKQLLREKMEQDATLDTASYDKEDVDDIEMTIASFREERRKLQDSFAQDRVQVFTQEPVVPLCPLLGEVEQARIAAALYVDETCSESLVVARLRDELFQLEVRERNAVMNAAILQDLEGADAALDLKIVDVEAFTSALDSVLAQFDATTAS